MSAGDALYASFGYALAARVLQSDLYKQLDDRERAECDAMIAGQTTATSAEQLREVAYMLLTQESRGEVLKWARGLTGNIGPDKDLSVRLERIADLCADRDRLRAALERAEKGYRNLADLVLQGPYAAECEEHANDIAAVLKATSTEGTKKRRSISRG